MKQPSVHGITIKKWHGQHFLRDQSVVDTMLTAVTLTPHTNVFEIGCGDGFLTRSILQTTIKRLWVFEIDPEWANLVQHEYGDARLSMFVENILDVDWQRFKQDAPWTLLANLPYNVSFPILYKLAEHRHFLGEGVVMVQEEVAQKLVSNGGRTFGYNSLYFQHLFELRLLSKIKPGAFYPPPKVDSRLVYFKPRPTVDVIPEEEQFWKFIKLCFRQPRRTLKNNLAQTHFDLERVPEKILLLRAQQMSKQDFLEVWNFLHASI